MSRILREKIITGSVVEGTVNPGETWSPYQLGLVNDYYPKYVIKNGKYPRIPWGSTQETRAGDYTLFAGNNETSAGREEYKAEIIIYKQKDDFEQATLSWNDVVVQPRTSGWGINFENLTIFYNDLKMVLHENAVYNTDVTFEDQFYRFNSMYTFADQIAANDPDKREFLQKSWKH